jgi:hypothetical protein
MVSSTVSMQISTALSCIVVTVALVVTPLAFFVIHQSHEDAKNHACGAALWKFMNAINTLKVINIIAVLPIHWNMKITSTEIMFVGNYFLLSALEYLKHKQLQTQAHTDQLCLASLVELYRTRYFEVAFTFFFSIAYDLGMVILLLLVCIRFFITSTAPTPILFPAARNTYGTFSNTV